MREVVPHSNRAWLALTAIVALLTGVTVWLAFDLSLKDLVLRGLEFVRSAGPAVFFLAMTVLPAFGAPLSFFSLTAGSLFAPRFGMPLVITMSLVAITFNMALSYLLARRGLRPLVEYFMRRLGFKLPQVRSGDASDLIVLMRVTPGVPFPVQNYLLGLSAVPIGRYLAYSCLIALPLNAAIIIFGEALMQGRGRTALVGLMLLVAAMTAIHLIRRHYNTGSRTMKS